MVINSAEIHRNLWLEFSWSRVAVSVGVFLLLCVLCLIMGDASLEARLLTLFWLSIADITFLAGLRGSALISASVEAEFSHHTWDYQRLSPLSPLSMCAGKVVGCTAGCWASALPALAVAIVLCFSAGHGIESVPIILSVCLLSLTLHALACGLSFMFVLRNGRGRGQAWFAIALVIVAQCIGAGVILAFIDWPSSTMSPVFRLPPVQWYSFRIPSALFVEATLVFFLLWAAYGAWRVTRRGLGYGSGPLAWTVFAAALTTYFTGLVDPVREGFSSFITAWGFWGLIIGVSGFLTLGSHYLPTPVGVEKSLDLFRHGRLKQALETVSPALPLFIFSILATACIWAGGGATRSDTSLETVALKTLLFVARDISVLWALHLRIQRVERSFPLFLVYLFVAYFIVPGIVGSLTGGAPATVLPMPSAGDFVWELFVVAVQTLIAVVCLRAQWARVSMLK